MVLTERSMYYRKYMLQITQPSQYRYTQLQYIFAAISEAPSMKGNRFLSKSVHVMFVLNSTIFYLEEFLFGLRYVNIIGYLVHYISYSVSSILF